MRILFSALIALMPAVASADEFCDQLWFSRNSVYDRAGYCFSSRLGRSVFDNSDCIEGVELQMSASVAKALNNTIQIEEMWECNVDTTRETLDVPDLEFLLSLDDIPLKSDGESGCIGWRGAPIAVRSGRSMDSAVIGIIPTGAQIGMGYWEIDGWEFLSTFGDQEVAGWANLDAIGFRYPDSCDGWAG